MLKTHWPLGLEVTFSLHASEKFKGKLTSGPKGRRTCTVDVRAKARTYQRTAFSAASKGSRPGSAGPNLLPRSIVSNSSQKCMDAECDYQSNQGEHADGYQKNAEAFYVATGDCQHRGVSLSDTATPRNITGMGYGGVDDLP